MYEHREDFFKDWKSKHPYPAYEEIRTMINKEINLRRDLIFNFEMIDLYDLAFHTLVNDIYDSLYDPVKVNILATVVHKKYKMEGFSILKRCIDKYVNIPIEYKIYKQELENIVFGM